jgi:hypothetical protein
VKGSPGVTTAAVALAATWPEDRAAVVAEVDPAGGDLAARFGLAEEPGLMSWAAASRRAPATEELLRHTQEIPGGIPVLVGPAGAGQAGGALRLLGSRAPLGFERFGDADVLADCGRLELTESSHPLVGQADLLILLVRPALGDLAHVAAKIDSVRPGACDTALVLAGSGPYPAKEVTDTLGIAVIGHLPTDPEGAGVCSGAGSSSPRAQGRSPLLRAARSLAEDLASWLAAKPGGQDAGAAAEAQKRVAPALEAAR